LKTLHRYITGQVLVTLVLTVGVCTFVVLLLNVLHDVLPLLLGGHAPLALIAKAVGLLVPFACVYALPMGFITATLLVFGRFSADQELTAVRASGISLLSLITPVLVLSLLGSALSAWFNMEIGPRSRVAFVNLRYDLLHVAQDAQLPEGQLIDWFPGYQVYVGKNDNGDLQDLSIYGMRNGTNWDFLLHAAHGRLNPHRASNQLALNLTDERLITRSAHGNVMSASPSDSINFSMDVITNLIVKPKVSDMTFGQLQHELRDIQARHLSPENVSSPEALASLRQMNLTWKSNATPAEAGALLHEADRVQAEQISHVRVAMHREIAFSFACFGFTLVGIPLGIRVQRRETNIGVVIALALVVVYYGFTMLGESLAAHPQFYPHLILWLPNFIFQAVGAVLLWRANRGI
jgi:lipopolysaccharide export system permease protein